MLENVGLLIYEIWKVLFIPFYDALNNFLVDYGTGINLDSIEINIGFGEIVWFSCGLSDLIIIVFGLTMTVIFLIVVFKLFKWFSSLFGNLFRGYRK